MMKKILTVIFTVLILISCSTNKKPAEKWSVRMVNSTIARWDTLTKASSKWTYDMALLARAIYEVSQVENNQEYYKYFSDYVDYFVGDSGTVKDYRPDEYNLDRIQPARNLLILYQKTGEEKYKLAMDRHVQQMRTHPRTKEGGFWHKKVYPYQMWLDGLYMAEPFLVSYAKEFNDTVWFSEAVNQLTMVYKRTVDAKTGLLYHAYDESREQRWCDPETGHSPHFWSRATGWYVMALVDVLDYLPENYSGRDTLIHLLQSVSVALEKVQDSTTGLWYQVLNMGGHAGNYLEASGSAMFVYAFAKGVKKGYLDSHFQAVAQKGFDGLTKQLIKENEDGTITLTQTCGGCGLGGNPYRDGSYDYYIHEKINENDTKGVAPFILASIELGQ